MVLRFSKFNESILLSPGGNWEKELISHLDYDEEYFQDICQDIIDSGSMIQVENKIFNDKFERMSGKGDLNIGSGKGMPTGWTKINWYQGYQLNIHTGSKVIGRSGIERHSVDEIIKIFPSVMEILIRLRTEFQIAVTRFDISNITIMILDTSKRIDPSEIKFKPTKNQIQRLRELNSPDPNKIAETIIGVSGGKDSIFHSKVEGGNIHISLRKEMETLKAQGILRNIMRKKIDRINGFSETKYEYSIFGANPWIIRVSPSKSIHIS